MNNYKNQIERYLSKLPYSTSKLTITILCTYIKTDDSIVTKYHTYSQVVLPNKTTR